MTGRQVYRLCLIVMIYEIGLHILPKDDWFCAVELTLLTIIGISAAVMKERP